MDVSIIVSNRNGIGMLRDCLDSLHVGGRPAHRHEILVTDNASTDGSVEMVRARYPAVRVLAHERDLGFVASNNRAIASSTGRYVHLLNNDTLVLPAAVDRLVDFMDGAPKAGAVGNRLVYPDGREQFSGRRFPTPVNALFGRLSVLSRWFPDNPWTRRYTFSEELEGDLPFEVDWVSAAGALYRRAALDDTGPMFEDYYYWHEAAYFLAMKRRGWTVHLHPTAWVIHHEGLGSGHRSAAVRARHHLDFAKGSYRFFCDHRRLRRADPRRWLTWLALYGRAGVLSAAPFLGVGGTRREPVDYDRAIHSAYGRLVQHLLASAGTGRILLVTSATPGEGVTTAAAALAQELAIRGDAETLLVDANPDRPALHRVFWAENGPGFSEMLAGTDVDLGTAARPLNGKLALLPHGHGVYNLMKRGTGEQLEACLQRLAEGRRFVVIDAPALDRRTDALTLAARVDGVILVVRAETVARERIQQAAAELRDAGGDLLGAIYNAKPFYIPEAIYRRV